MNAEWTLLLGVGSLVVIGAGFFARYMANKHSLVDDLSLDCLDAITEGTKRQRKTILKEALRATKEKLSAAEKQFNEEANSVLELQSTFAEELAQRQSNLDKQLNILKKQEEETAQKEAEQKETQEEINTLSDALKEKKENQIKELEQKSHLTKQEAFEVSHTKLIQHHKHDLQGWLQENVEATKKLSQRTSQGILERVDSRYAPQFVWPKNPFNVVLPNKNVAQRHFHEEAPIVDLLMAQTDTQISWDVPTLNDMEAQPILRITGGAGVDKEAIRLTIEELLGRKSYHADKALHIFRKNRRFLEKHCQKMGEQAVRELRLDKIHPEILKLVGALNYRTSHRQNQYFHSLEVARLAGMLADEVGVDHQLAKRSGLLHDIGKVLDYKIEGSHAVISGDLAVQFGEEENVVDTVLSHHDDKIVETPHAYILKAADAMSGARPGARVDMEEGYQKRIENIQEVVEDFKSLGVKTSAVMHAGRELHIFVDQSRIHDDKAKELAQNIARKLEDEVQFPGQIKVTVIRRTETSVVA